MALIAQINGVSRAAIDEVNGSLKGLIEEVLGQQLVVTPAAPTNLAAAIVIPANNAVWEDANNTIWEDSNNKTWET